MNFKELKQKFVIAAIIMFVWVVAFIVLTASLFIRLMLLTLALGLLLWVLFKKTFKH